MADAPVLSVPANAPATPVSEPAAAPAPAPASAPAPAPAPAPVVVVPADPEPAASPVSAVVPDAGHWFDAVQEGDVRDWAQRKSMDKGTIGDVIGSYFNLEKIVGADKAGRTVTLLGDDATPEQAGEFYTKLGRPADATGYGFVSPEGEDGAFADWAGKTFFEAGLTAKQANFMSEKWEAFVADHKQAATDAETVSRVDAEAELKTEWGAAYDQKVAGIDTAAVALGMTKENLDGLRSAMGPVAAMKFIDGLNTKIGEHKYETGDPAGSGVMTPQQAKLALSELTMNKEFTDAWMDKQHPGHLAAVQKKANLSKLATGVAA